MNSNLAENKDIDILQVLEANENKAAKKDDNTDKQIVKLQEELSGEKSARKTERFAWILADAILVDCLILPPLSISANAGYDKKRNNKAKHKRIIFILFK